MELGVGHSSLAVYRAIKGGDSGLNLKLSDLMDKEVQLPNLYEVIMSLFTRKPLFMIIKGYPIQLIRKLLTVQKKVDSKMEREIRKARSKIR